LLVLTLRLMKRLSVVTVTKTPRGSKVDGKALGVGGSESTEKLLAGVKKNKGYWFCPLACEI